MLCGQRSPRKIMPFSPEGTTRSLNWSDSFSPRRRLLVLRIVFIGKVAFQFHLLTPHRFWVRLPKV
jgi:hypothetical protein